MGKVLLAAVALSACASMVAPDLSSAGPSRLQSRDLSRAQVIRTEISARYRLVPRGGLAVTEATSTGVVESFALTTSDLRESHVLPAANGIWYAICPVRARCPYPARPFARVASDRVLLRMSLELVLRTFVETGADLVAVSLPTLRFTALVVARKDLAREIDLRSLARALRGSPARALSASVEDIVRRVSRPRVFLFAGLEPTPSGRSAWVGLPLWPTAGSS
jgi:hypothetical protein